jgi:hypothetical protein
MTNNKQQTAVEWGIEKLASLTFDYMAGFISKREYEELSKGVIRQAKEMEKQQIINAIDSNYTYNDNQILTIGEQYYNETYGGNK